MVGLKPTCGTLSTEGLVPCCPSVDCPSVFALSVADAIEVASIALDSERPMLPFDRTFNVLPFSLSSEDSVAFILAPSDDDLEFFGNDEGKSLYLSFLHQLDQSGLELKQFDFAPFREAGNLLFDGPFIADRFSSIGEFVQSNQSSVPATTSTILSKATTVSGSDVFKALDRIKRLKSYVQCLVGPEKHLHLSNLGSLCIR